MSTDLANKKVFYQKSAVISHNSPTGATRYWITDTLHNARIYSIAMRCTWTTQPALFELYANLDGYTNIGPAQVVNPLSETYYYAHRTSSVVPQPKFILDTTDQLTEAFLIEGQSVRFGIEFDVSGVCTNIRATLIYGVLKP